MSTPDYTQVIDRISTALSTAALQNRVTASNIANRDSADYVRLKLAFDEALVDGPTIEGRDIERSSPLSAPSPQVGTDHRTVSLEEDMLELSRNTMNFQALAKALGRYFAIANTIASGGKV